jgi:hypothetical protein
MIIPLFTIQSPVNHHFKFWWLVVTIAITVWKVQADMVMLTSPRTVQRGRHVDSDGMRERVNQ